MWYWSVDADIYAPVHYVLQAKFAGAPLQLEDVIRRLKKLNTPNVTREKVHIKT